MSKFWKFTEYYHDVAFGKSRGNQPSDLLEQNFDPETLEYLSERIINHLADSMRLLLCKGSFNGFNDYSFLTSPSAKALEGFLFQIGEDLDLPSKGREWDPGRFFHDTEAVDAKIDALLKEFDDKIEGSEKIMEYEKNSIKQMIKGMREQLRFYRHNPAHFTSESIDTVPKAEQSILSVYQIINQTTKILLNKKLVTVKEDIH